MTRFYKINTKMTRLEKLKPKHNPLNFAQTPEFFQMYTAWHFVMREKEESEMKFKNT